MPMKRHRWLEDDVVRSQLSEADNLLGAVLGDGEFPPAFHSQAISIRSKRLRPALVLLAARWGASSRESESLLIRAAVAVELVHEATLYHDDIVDEASLRRGEPTTQRRFGPLVAGLAGTELLYAAAELCVDLPAALRRALTRTGRALSHGQAQEVALQGYLRISERERLRIMRLKTAHVFGLAAHLGAALAGVDDDIAVQLVRSFKRFGMCFQLADDIRDLVAPTESLGRPPGADLRDGVYTLPAIYALREQTRESIDLIATLRRLLRTDDPDLVRPAVEAMRTLGGIGAASRTLASWLTVLQDDVAAIGVAAPRQARLSLENLVAAVASSCFSDHPPTGRHSYAGEGLLN
jgi:heptaprenyl diphosphate synthase